MVKVKRGRFTKDTSCESIKTRSLQQYAERLSSHWILAFAKTRRRIYAKGHEIINLPDRPARYN